MFGDWPPCLKGWPPPYSHRKARIRGKYWLQRPKDLLARAMCKGATSQAHGYAPS
jgi:hypothetical protein